MVVRNTRQDKYSRIPNQSVDIGMGFQLCIHSHAVQPHRVNLITFVRYNYVNQIITTQYDTIIVGNNGTVLNRINMECIGLHCKRSGQRMCRMDVGKGIGCSSSIINKFIGNILAVHYHRNNFVARIRRDRDNRIGTTWEKRSFG